MKRIVGATPNMVRVEVDVAKDAPIGPRDVSVAGVVRPSAVVVFDKVDAIKVTPQAGMARVGGINFPKQFHSSKQ